MAILVGHWPCDDESLVAEDHSGNGYDGVWLDTVTWDNHAEDMVLTDTEWTLTDHFSIIDDVALLDRDVITTNPFDFRTDRISSDARNSYNYNVSHNLQIESIEDNPSGTIIRFKTPFKANRKYTITARNNISGQIPGGADITVAAGTSYTWEPEESDLSTTEISSVRTGLGGFEVLFNADILPEGRIAGISIEWIDWKKNGFVVWTNSSGNKTIILSDFYDIAGNPIAETTRNITIQESSRTYTFGGELIEEKYVAQDTFEDKIHREMRDELKKTL